FRATLFEKSAQTNWLIPWHQDTALPLESKVGSKEWGPWSEKAGVLYAHAPAWALNEVVALRVHLDPCDEDNGPLKVIPKSHLYGVLSDAAVAKAAKSNEHEVCLCAQGQILVMRPPVIHSSSKARTGAPRRVLHIEYSSRLQLDAAAKLAIA